MANKSTTDSCCLTLPLVLEKWQSDRLEKRFEIARQIYNSLLNFEIKKFERLKQTDEYIDVSGKLKEMYENGESGSHESKAELYKTRNALLKSAGFNEYAFKTDAKYFYKHFNENIGSHVAVHGIASQVWAAFEKYLYGNGKAVHFKKRGQLSTLRGYSDSKKSGGTEIIFKGTHIEWKGLKLPIKLSKNNDYENEMLQNRVKYCRIVKKAGKNKPRWYVQLTLECRPAIKTDKSTGEPLHPVGKGSVGIDIGPQTIAYVADNEVALLELADKVKNIEYEKQLIQRKLDRSRRATNPANFAEDGTIKRGVKLKWIKSKRYLKLQHELAYLQFQQAETRKRQHTELANHLISLGDRFYVEKMDWSSLTHRAKETAISPKTGRYKKKKRFGRSVGNKAPAKLIEILNQKLVSRGYEGVSDVSTKVRASQYNHILDEYHKKELSERWNEMPDGRKIQRDIYSAFLLQHIAPDLNGFDREACIKDYDGFVELHDDAIEKLKRTPKILASMGIVRA